MLTLPSCGLVCLIRSILSTPGLQTGEMRLFTTINLGKLISSTRWGSGSGGIINCSDVAGAGSENILVKYGLAGVKYHCYDTAYSTQHTHTDITEHILKVRPALSSPLCQSAWRTASVWPGTPPTPGWGRRRRRRRAACWPASWGGGTRRSGEQPWSRVSRSRAAHNRFRDVGQSDTTSMMNGEIFFYNFTLSFIYFTII